MLKLRICIIVQLRSEPRAHAEVNLKFDEMLVQSQESSFFARGCKDRIWCRGSGTRLIPMSGEFPAVRWKMRRVSLQQRHFLRDRFLASPKSAEIHPRAHRSPSIIEPSPLDSICARRLSLSIEKPRD